MSATTRASANDVTIVALSAEQLEAERQSLRTGLLAQREAVAESLTKLVAKRAEIVASVDEKIAETERMLAALDEQLGG